MFFRKNKQEPQENRILVYGDKNIARHTVKFKFIPGDEFFLVSKGVTQKGEVERVSFRKEIREEQITDERTFFHWNKSKYTSVSENMFLDKKEAILDWAERQKHKIGSLSHSDYEKNIEKADDEKPTRMEVHLKFDIGDNFFAMREGSINEYCVDLIKIEIEKRKDGPPSLTTIYNSGTESFYSDSFMFETKEEVLENWIETQLEKEPV